MLSLGECLPFEDSYELVWCGSNGDPREDYFTFASLSILLALIHHLVFLFSFGIVVVLSIWVLNTLVPLLKFSPYPIECLDTYIEY